MIKKEGGKYSVWSEDGKKRLGKPGSKAKAEKRLAQIEWFKHHPEKSVREMVDEPSEPSLPALPSVNEKSYSDFIKSTVSKHIDENTTVKTKELCLSLGLDYKKFMGFE